MPPKPQPTHASSTFQPIAELSIAVGVELVPQITRPPASSTARFDALHVGALDPSQRGLPGCESNGAGVDHGTVEIDHMDPGLVSRAAHEQIAQVQIAVFEPPR